MNKTLTKISLASFGAIMAIGAAISASAVASKPIEVKAADGDSIALTSSSITKLTETTGYAAYNGSRTITSVNGDEYSFTTNNVMPNSSNIQFKASTGKLYNTTAFANNIENVVITGTNALTVYFGTTSDPTANSVIYSGSGPYTYTPSGDYKYVSIAKTNSGAASASAITINLVDAVVPDTITRKAASFDVYRGSTLTLSTCVTTTGSGDLSFSADTTSYGTISEGVFTASAVGGPTTITATKGEASTTFTINVLELPTYNQITDEKNLYSGLKFILGNDTNDMIGGNLSSQIINGVSATISEGSVSTQYGTVLELEGTVGAWKMKNSSGEYLYPTAAKKLAFDDDPGDGAAVTWEISVDPSTGNAEVASSNDAYGVLEYNHNNGTNPRFTTYTSGQSPIQLYAKDEADTEQGHIYSFIRNYMRMGDTSLIGTGSGSCKSEGYYSAAKAAFNGVGLTDSERVAFFNGSNTQYAAARARLTAWAAANGESFDVTDKVLKSSYVSIYRNDTLSEGVNSGLIAGLTIGLGTLAVGGGTFLFIRRRKED